MGVLSLSSLPLTELVGLLSSRQVSATEVMESSLEVIARRNPELNALVTLTAERALERARDMDRAGGPVGPLGGVPSADKDLVHRAGVPTGFGSRLQKHFAVPTVSDPMALWLDDSGAISVGKTAVCEWGLTSSSESLAHGATVTPYHRGHSAGGSSGGAAAAVASGMLAFAPGSDGGGSLRIPAWHCGVVALKPSRGRVPAGPGVDGVAGLTVPGIIARSVADVALATDALCRGEWNWSTGAPPWRSTLCEQLDRDLSGLRIGFTTTHPWPDQVGVALHPSAEGALHRALALLQPEGADVAAWEWSPAPGYFEAFLTLWSSSTVTLPLRDEWLDELEPLTRSLVERGRRLSAAELVSAVAWLRRFEHDTISSLREFDVVATPGLALPPPPVGFYDAEDATENFLQQVRVTPYTSFVNVSGLPALALPMGVDDNGLPLGVQLIAGPGREDVLVAVARRLEQVRGAMPLPANFG